MPKGYIGTLVRLIAKFIKNCQKISIYDSV